ncbi:hypothetical protein KSE_02750 [Kitasatospora setae KM-6054]|uniref:DUF1877 family protein n=1 Tax=Kitasatospora setae (strain ATCC 33774 / DSM 43861 / JCM 3304 / KCC A-0304 / NBRC 14216 / KM-6054) TaxID=452652 RepID=E4N4J1_KITSK|nr:hypothetical protein KSE_02750 [Kitasatospora setae KM-6054]
MEFFAAPDDTSAAPALPAGPGRAFAPLSYGNFDPEEAALTWQGLLTGRRFEELAEADEPRLVAGEDDGGGPVVLALPPRLSAALADAGPAALDGLAAGWARQSAADGEAIGAGIAAEIVRGVAALARAARERGEGVYCWVG